MVFASSKVINELFILIMTLKRAFKLDSGKEMWIFLTAELLVGSAVYRMWLRSHTQQCNCSAVEMSAFSTIMELDDVSFVVLKEPKILQPGPQ